jgi:hypothetical protein
MDRWIRAWLLKKQAHVLLVERGGGIVQIQKKGKCKDFAWHGVSRKTWSFLSWMGCMGLAIFPGPGWVVGSRARLCHLYV